MNIFSDDQIYAPSIVPLAIFYAWKQSAKLMSRMTFFLTELSELFAWIDKTARGKPSSSFWQGAF